MNLMYKFTDAITNSWYSQAKQLEELQIIKMRELSAPTSAEIIKKLEPLINILQSKDKINLEIRSFSQLPFVAAKGFRDNGLLLINEDDLKNLPEEDLQAILSHEWGHIIHGDGITGRLAEMMNMAISFFAALSCGSMTALAEYSFSISAISTGITFGLTYYIVDKVAGDFFEKHHECHADLYAIQKQGIPLEKLIGLLEKLKQDSRCLSDHTRSLINIRISSLKNND